MKVVHPPKRENNVMVFPPSLKVAMGHRPYESGGGAHKDRRTKRCRTRAAKHKAALAGW